MKPAGGYAALAYVLTRYLAPALPELQRIAERMRAEEAGGAQTDTDERLAGLEPTTTAAGPGMGPRTLRGNGALEGAHP